MLENTPPGFKSLFSRELGFVKDDVYQTNRRADIPVSAKLRRLLLAFRQVSDELERLEHKDIIERVDISE